MPVELKRKPAITIPEREVIIPFEDIAVCLSGGGFRAAGFSLGCLAYLQRRSYEGSSLLNRVKLVVGASGGTLTGLLYSAYNHLGQPFSKVYEKLRREVLVGDLLLKEAVKVIADDKQWHSSSTRNRNTINAFARVYHKQVFDKMDFGVYWKGNGTVEEVCFNASELENGRTFRFQTDGKDDTHEIIGNQYLAIKDKNLDIIKDLQLGDILAASSCFPAGFEPMIFPGDFAKDKKHYEELKSHLTTARGHDWEVNEPFPRSFALMDGGITDNQCIESLRLANRRRTAKNGRGYDLILICDVANYFLDAFEPLKAEKSWMDRISMYDIIKAHKYAGLVLLGSIFMHIFNVWTGLAWVLTTVSAIMFGIFLYGRYILSRMSEPGPATSPAADKPEAGAEEVKKKVTDNMNMFDLPLLVFGDYFLQTPLSRMGLMLKSRIRSAMRVAMDIYVLQIRRINYENLYSDPEWAYKTKAVSIYELSKSNEHVLERQFRRKEFDEATVNQLTPSEKIKEVAERARQMETTLWFSKSDMQGNRTMPDALIASGQFTMCYNLLEYIIQVEKEYPQLLTDEHIQQLKKEITEDWKRFQDDPYFMLDDVEV